MTPGGVEGTRTRGLRRDSPALTAADWSRSRKIRRGSVPESHALQMRRFGTRSAPRVRFDQHSFEQSPPPWIGGPLRHGWGGPPSLELNSFEIRVPVLYLHLGFHAFQAIRTNEFLQISWTFRTPRMFKSSLPQNPSKSKRYGENARRDVSVLVPGKVADIARLILPGASGECGPLPISDILNNNPESRFPALHRLRHVAVRLLELVKYRR